MVSRTRWLSGEEWLKARQARGKARVRKARRGHVIVLSRTIASAQLAQPSTSTRWQWMPVRVVIKGQFVAYVPSAAFTDVNINVGIIQMYNYRGQQSERIDKDRKLERLGHGAQSRICSGCLYRHLNYSIRAN